MDVLSRNLSADGNRVFFESVDPLVAADTTATTAARYGGTGNQQAASRACQDVYEWEAEGSGCMRHGGARTAAASTCSPPEPDPEAASSSTPGRDGDDVFIFTQSPLVGQDRDALSMSTTPAWGRAGLPERT